MFGGFGQRRLRGLETKEGGRSLWTRVAVAIAIGCATVATAIAQAPDLAPPKPLGPQPATSTSTAASAGLPGQQAARQLTQTDVDAWLDGFMPYALQTGDIAGAVVVVVKDGKVLTQRGYGYADVKTQQPVDPAATLFRPGSVSKLFTWTAVMQQVQAGKLDLDRDVNDYLDFRIPPHVRQADHAAQPDDAYAGLRGDDQISDRRQAADSRAARRLLKPLGAGPDLRAGHDAAYSNYGAALAGYIVQRVSGEPFDDYVAAPYLRAARHGAIRASSSRCRPTLAAACAKGYMQRLGRAGRQFELVTTSPGRRAVGTGADMAQLHDRASRQRRSAARPEDGAADARDRPTRRSPGCRGMALGFYHEDRNGLNDHRPWRRHRLCSIPTCISISTRASACSCRSTARGKEGAAHVLRGRLFDELHRPLFPATKRAGLPTLATAAEHGRLMAGHYVSSRGSTTNWLRIADLHRPGRGHGQ